MSRSPTHSDSDSDSAREDWSAMPSAELIVCLTMPASWSLARSANHTPSGYWARTWWASRSTVRDLPTPPMPVTVTSRDSPRCRLRLASRRVRPMKLVSSAGRLPSRHPDGVAMRSLTGG
ncbi:hypothetical protein [Nonomuraea zeae]|uniref:hypothetical protein n=1 Tax=Nonomuraea zeae TaxID=1642303 RepID=UPI001F0E39E4|nr:hypothetical protein [Nonomuraea zeae]